MDIYTQPEWEHSALLTIDVQEDFSRRDAPFYISGTERILPALKKLTRYYREQARPIIHIVRLYRRDGSNVDLCRRLDVKQGVSIAAPGSEGAELVSELKPVQSVRLNHEQLLNGGVQNIHPNEWILYNPRWGAFYQTDLEQLLSERDISTVVVAGCNFPNCPPYHCL